MSEYDVVIVGAGAAGLAAGHALQEAGRKIILVEARGRIGGRAFTQMTRLGLPVDLGCGWLHSADRNPFVEVARGLGFAIDEELPDWTRSPRSFPRAEWRVAYSALAARIHAAAENGAEGAAADLLEPGGRWNAAMNAISTYANGTELDRVSIRDNARYDDSGVNWRVRAGYGALVAAWGAPLPVALETPVQRIRHGGKTIEIETGKGTLRAAAIIVTLPTNVIAAGEIAFDPPLRDKIDAAAGLPLGLANKLYFELTGPAEAFPSNHHIMGSPERSATASYQLRPHGLPLVEAYIGGRNARALEEEGEAAMVAFARDELAGHFGAAIKERLRPVGASAWATDPWARGSYSCALPFHADDRARLAAPVENRLFFAGEATHPTDFSTAHGAYLSGLRAAAEAIAALNASTP